MKRNRLFLLLALIVVSFAFSSNKPSFIASPDARAEQWVDSVFNAMTLDQQIGQLFMIRAHSDLGAEHIQAVEAQIKQYEVGGLCFFQGSPEKQVELINRYQKQSPNLPLMIGIDGEWGLGMRMKATTISYPKQIALGAIQDNRLIYEMGEEVARQMKRVGVHVNFAPVADVNNNPENPVINTRSFGEDRYNVAVKSYMYMKGMQDNGVMACAKHFPGHGDTNVDSHKDLPVIPHDFGRLDSIELYPFKVLAEQGIGSFMVAHLSVPTLDDRANRPTTLSRNTVTGLIREKMGYDGLIFTDALEMEGLTKYFQPGQSEAEALLAGNDILLLPRDIAAAFEAIKDYVTGSRIDNRQFEASVKRILRAKYNLGLTKFEPIPTENVLADLNSDKALAIKSKLYEHAITLVNNQNNLLPIRSIDSMKIAALSLGSEKITPFQERLSDYAPVTNLFTDKNVTDAEIRSLMRQIEDKDLVIIGLHNLSSYASRKFGINASEINFINQIATRKKVVLVHFGNPYALQKFEHIPNLINAYEEDEMAQDLAAQAIFGAIAMQGKLPVSVSVKLPFNKGTSTNQLYRLGYSYPENVGLNSDTLSRIDELMADAIEKGATPGGVVLVAKDGKIVFEKAYGHQTYGKRKRIKTDDMYDLASITKIAASTIAIMKLHEEGKISIYQPLAKYLPELMGTNKADLTLFDVMAHRAGLKSWIPFYLETIEEAPKSGSGSLVSSFYSRRPNEEFSIPVTNQLYLRQDYRDTIWQQIYDSPVSPQKEYVYSDLGFYLVSKIVAEQTGQSINEYVADQFYSHLGLGKTTYLPLEKFNKQSIVPSEDDRYWRNQQVQGNVHDMGAAMLGGVSGHAGLFSTAKEVAVIMQMLLNMGYYGGEQYLNPSTVHTFTTRHPEGTRRGIGFDMLELDRSKDPNLSIRASERAFGHLGFTGTATWADPEHNLVFVFLSNRTYPTMRNYKLGKYDYRPRIQTVIYNAMELEDTTVSN